MNTPPMVQLLNDNGYTDGWAIAGDVLTVWEHDEEPPAPLVRPSEVAHNE